MEEESSSSPSTPHYGLIGIAVLAIVGILFVLASLPAVETARGASKRASCINKQKLIGLAIHNYGSAFERFPPGATWVKQGDRPKIMGWSFYRILLPYMELDALSRAIPPGSLPETAEAGTPERKVVDQVLHELVCPTSPNCMSIPSTGKDGGALTSYKGLAGTCEASVMTLFGQPPPYPGKHPDGALCPALDPDSNKGLQFRDIRDGLSHTLCLGESIEDTSARWAYATETLMVGLPNKVVRSSKLCENGNYMAPEGFDERYGEDSGVTRAGHRTFLGMDFSPAGADAAAGLRYEDLDFGQQNRATYGPSSGHPEIANHLLCDGSVKTLHKNVDAAAYMFLITRNGNDGSCPGPH